MAILGVLVAAAQILLMVLELAGLEHLDKETLAAQALAVLTGLVVAVVAHLRLVQITQPQIQVALVEQELQAA
jgi:hypothetical protein